MLELQPHGHPTLFPYTTLFRSEDPMAIIAEVEAGLREALDPARGRYRVVADRRQAIEAAVRRSEEHTSELQSHHELVCRLLLEKKMGEAKVKAKAEFEPCLKST